MAGAKLPISAGNEEHENGASLVKKYAGAPVRRQNATRSPKFRPAPISMNVVLVRLRAGDVSSRSEYP
jgi:hypothetical protein